MKNSSRGFTLLEMIVALAISALIMIGLYGMFTSLINTREAVQKKNDENILLMNARKLVKADMLQLVKDSLVIDNSDNNQKFSITTYNSIKLENSVPVTVTYSLDDGWLIREEENKDLGYYWKLRLLPDTEDLLTLSHNGYRFTEDYDKTDTIIQMSFIYKGRKYQLIAGCAMPSDGEGTSDE